MVMVVTSTRIIIMVKVTIYVSSILQLCIFGKFWCNLKWKQLTNFNYLLNGFQYSPMSVPTKNLQELQSYIHNYTINIGNNSKQI